MYARCEIKSSQSSISTPLWTPAFHCSISSFETLYNPPSVLEVQTLNDAAAQPRVRQFPREEQKYLRKQFTRKVISALLDTILP